MIMLDNTVVNVALPSIRKDLGIGISELEWVVNAYALTFGVLLLTGGKLADMLGRRAIFIAGLVIFTVSSLACGLANGSEVLIAARTVQGIGAALMNPATLSIITATFPPRQRGMAIGIWAGVSALALAFGPIVGGLLTEKINWSWIFFINVPIGVLGVLAARVFIDETKDSSVEQRLDLPGLLTSSLGLFALTFGLIETYHHAWTSAIVLSMLLLAVVSLAIFGIFFFTSLFVQNILGFSAIETGASFLPMTVLIILVAPVAGKISDQVGPRWLMGTGMVLLSVSLLLFGRLEVDSTFWGLLPAMLAGGFGMAITMAPTTSAAMGAVPVDKAGVGSAVINSMRQVGGSIGIALMGALVATQLSVKSPENPRYGPQFIDGFHLAVHVGAALVLVGAVLSVLLVRHVRHFESHAAAEPAVGGLAVSPKHVVPSGPPWRLGVSPPPAPRRDPDEGPR